MLKFIYKYKYIITFILVICLVFSAIFLKIYLDNNKLLKTNEVKAADINLKKEETTEITNEEKEKLPSYVDIKGAIMSPGVYQIHENTRVIDVINLAGGLTEKSNTSLINLSKLVEDQMVIVVYTDEEVVNLGKENKIEIIDTCKCPSIQNDACICSEELASNISSDKENDNSSSNNNEKTDFPININTASLEQLQLITGIGESKAKAIIKYREENGNFKSIEDIMNVSGIGQSTFEKIKDQITV